MLLTIAVSGYRSLRHLVLPLTRLNVITGPNGSGKSSVYRSIRLLADSAQGRVVSSLAIEGGLQSTLWAGPENISRAMKRGKVPIEGAVRKGPVALKLGFADEDYGYAIDLGLPIPTRLTAFNRDPVFKAEAVWAGDALRRNNMFASRRGPGVHVLNKDGSRATVFTDLPAFESMMTHAADPRGAPELLVLRERMREWRFYDHFRTDGDAPARHPRLGTRTVIMAADGSDFAAAMQTIREIGDNPTLDASIDDAFPGSAIEVIDTDGLFEVVMRQTGLLRPLKTSELSDGTLRYLLLVAALLTPRPPPLMVLNEPETSLHPDLLLPLARLIIAASKHSQIIVVSHAKTLVEALGAAPESAVYGLEKRLGETVIPDIDPPPWAWPTR